MSKPAELPDRRRKPKRNQPEYLFGSLMSTPVRLAYGLGPVIQVLEDYGHAVTPLLGVAEIPRFALEEPSYRIRLDQEMKFTRLALAELKLPAAGLIVGRRYHLAMFGILGLAASCAPTLRDLFRTMLSYPVLAWGLIECSVWRDGAEGFVDLKENAEVGDCGSFFVERDMTCALTLLRDTLGPHVVPVSVRFRHLPPPDADAYEEFFGCDVLFGENVNQMRFDAGFWDEAPPQANEMSFRFFENQCRRVSDMLLEPFDYTDIVKSRLRSATPIPSLPELADALRMTERTLQRRLEAENTSFSTLLKEVRLERAVELLRHQDVRLDEIADTLGFKDAVAFSHAFKNWTGLSPSRYR